MNYQHQFPTSLVSSGGLQAVTGVQSLNLLSFQSSQWLRPLAAGGSSWLPLAWRSVTWLSSRLNKQLPDSLVCCAGLCSEKGWETLIGYNYFHYSIFE